MYELIQAAGDSYFIESPAKVGLVKVGGNEVVLIDSGSDKDAGRKIRQILDANGWKLRAILNTHSNADHIGGNSYLQKQTGCRIFAPGPEYAFQCRPYRGQQLSPEADWMQDIRTGNRMLFYKISCSGAVIPLWRISTAIAQAQVPYGSGEQCGISFRGGST